MNKETVQKYLLISKEAVQKYLLTPVEDLVYQDGAGYRFRLV